MSELPAHLGGHYGYTNDDIGVLETIIRRRRPKSFFDIGCGPGGMIRAAMERGLTAGGCDGDYTLDFDGLDVEIHDFTTGPFYPAEVYDIGWSVEFLEHVEERYLDNIRPAFKACRSVFMTHALPKQRGHHHVNLQRASYWIDVFADWGFAYDAKFSEVLCRDSTMKDGYTQRTGMFFEAIL